MKIIKVKILAYTGLLLVCTGLMAVLWIEPNSLALCIGLPIAIIGCALVVPVMVRD